MSKNTLFNYFTRSPASQASCKPNESPATTSNGSPNGVSSKTPKRPFKENSTPTPKRTPKSVSGSSKKYQSNNSSSKKTVEKRKSKQLGNILFNWLIRTILVVYLAFCIGSEKL